MLSRIHSSLTWLPPASPLPVPHPPLSIFPCSSPIQPDTTLVLSGECTGNVCVCACVCKVIFNMYCIVTWPRLAHLTKEHSCRNKIPWFEATPPDYEHENSCMLTLHFSKHLEVHWLQTRSNSRGRTHHPIAWMGSASEQRALFTPDSTRSKYDWSDWSDWLVSRNTGS